jgi:myo-inositol-1(or 4)-monophosphatase
MTQGALVDVDLAAVHPVLAQAMRAAEESYFRALAEYPRDRLAEEVGLGGDGTPTTYLDELVDCEVLEAVKSSGVNVLSEEAGWIDRGSSLTLIVDPLDGTANAVAGVPICAFAGALAVDGVITEGLVSWIDMGRRWHARAGEPRRGVAQGGGVSGRRQLLGASVSMLRPRPDTRAAWTLVAMAAARVRVLGSSVIEACLVADGVIDAFVDCGGEVHRIVDLAATHVIVESAGGTVIDVFGRPIEMDTDLTRRWSGIAASSPELASEIAAAVRTTQP